MTMRFLSSLSLASLVITASLGLTGCGDPGDGPGGLQVQRITSAGGSIFSDEFEGGSLGPDWVVDAGAFATQGGTLVEVSGARYTTARMRYVGGQTETDDQFSKLRIVQSSTHTWGFVFRADASSAGSHYQVLLLSNGTWSWAMHDPDFVEVVGNCSGGTPLSDGDWIAATVEGSGPNTVISGWRWPNDPDAGGPVDIANNWGPPHCQITADPSQFVDVGGTIGIRSYTGNSTSPAAADGWSGGDLDAAVGTTCGDGVPEGPEECDTAGESMGCDVDCSFPLCGDGMLNTSASEQCESDTDCPGGEICDGGCACIPAPECGDGVPEGPEQCDTAGESASCDVDCSFPLCGDGMLNTSAGEQCESNSDCAAGEVCNLCACEIPSAQLFSDEFEGGSLGPDWVVDAGAFATQGGTLVEVSGARYTTARMRYVGGQTETDDQFSKLRIVQSSTHTWGFVFRADASSAGSHYQVLLLSNGTWSWAMHDPDFVEVVGNCSGGTPLSDGDWIAATVEGSGPNTVISGWRWPNDPDAGGPVDIANNWGPPHCQITADPSQFVDVGGTIGIRSYTGNSTSPAAADGWSGGDLDAAVGTTCGDGVPEGPEECDTAGESMGCDVDCSFPLCGDGMLNTSASEQCESDTDCPGGEICDGGCACIPAPECGDGVPEGPEQCDTAGESASCDVDCSFPLCGDGMLNTSAGEQCESNSDCAAGEVCNLCACEIPSAQLFSDEFEGGSLGPDWVVDAGAFATQGGTLVEVSGARYTTARMRYVGGQTETDDQFSKLRIVQSSTHTWGFVFRADASSAGSHYQVLLLSNGTWSWAMHDPDFVEVVGNCSGGTPLSDGDWIAATVEGSGPNTVISGWRWPNDPDAGGPVDIANNWGPPHCQITADPSQFVDVGGTIGIRSYTGNSTSPAAADGWSGGDLVDPIVAPQPPITLILDRSGEGTPNSMIDPDGIAVDSAGNVYVAACGYGAPSTGFFKITPGGTVTRLIDSTGDGVHPFDCGVGVDVDSSDNVYVVAFLSDNVFKVTPTGEITQILDSSGAGSPNSMSGPIGVAVSNAGDVYVSAFFSNTVHKITPQGDKSLVLDSSGDGMSNAFLGPFEIDTDPFGNVFVAANESDNVFKITPAGLVSEVIGASGDGTNPLWGPHGLGCDAAGNVYVAGNGSDNVFRIEPSGSITQIMDISGDGAGNLLDSPTGLKATADGKVYVTAYESDNAFEWDSGTATQILTVLGDGLAPFENPADDTVAIGPNGEVYMTGTESDTVFRVLLP